MAPAAQESPVRLRRSVGLFRLVLYGVGTILMAGKCVDDIGLDVVE